MPNKKTKLSKKLKIIACIQARMSSQRLKKKALLKIASKTPIEHIFQRLKESKEIDDVVLATSTNIENDVLVEHAKSIGLKFYRGSEEDLVSRLYLATEHFKGDALVRITADCPLVDPILVDKLALTFRENSEKFDYLTNVFPPTFPDGLDIEILPFSTLQKLNKELAKNSLHREWLTAYIMENPKKFRIYNLKNKQNLSGMRFTLDYPEDMVFLEKIFKALGGKNKVFTMDEIVNLCKKNPQLLKINARWVDGVVVNDIRSGAYQEVKKTAKI